MFPLGITGRICLKSPPKTIIFPPNIELDLFSFLIISFNVLSSASKQNLCAIGASSHIINSAYCNNSETSLPCWILQTEVSSVGTGILNFECVVLPPGNNRDAIPLDATVKTFFVDYAKLKPIFST